jgi:hypothetical protein
MKIAIRSAQLRAKANRERVILRQHVSGQRRQRELSQIQIHLKTLWTIGALGDTPKEPSNHYSDRDQKQR